MELEAFTSAWAEAWGQALNSSEAYRTAAATWEGAVALLLDDGDPPGRRAVLLDLWHGACTRAEAADPDDLTKAAFVFAGPTTAWKQVLLGGTSPALALLTGRIRLTQGDLHALLPFASAARELLALAGTIPASFSEG